MYHEINDEDRLRTNLLKLFILTCFYRLNEIDRLILVLVTCFNKSLEKGSATLYCDGTSISIAYALNYE